MSHKNNITVLYYYEYDKIDQWKNEFEIRAPYINLVDKDDKDSINASIALVWAPPIGFLKNFNNLKGVINLGQGVDHLLIPGVVPEGLPIVRLVDEEMSKLMAAWVSHQVLSETCFSKSYREQEINKVWKALPLIPSADWNIGILGMGALGSFVAQNLTQYGYNVMGWSRNLKSIKKVKCYHGENGLSEMLPKCRILICLLPLTNDTHQILNKYTFKKLPKGATIINAGRGGHINENDLLGMLESKHIKNAYLDVFEKEPLPKDNSFWEHKDVVVWPHVAAQTNTSTSIDQIINAINCINKNKEAPNTIDRQKGY